jgi:hypothetical protein
MKHISVGPDLLAECFEEFSEIGQVNRSGDRIWDWMVGLQRLWYWKASSDIAPTESEYPFVRQLMLAAETVNGILDRLKERRALSALVLDVHACLVHQKLEGHELR